MDNPRVHDKSSSSRHSRKRDYYHRKHRSAKHRHADRARHRSRKDRSDSYCSSEGSRFSGSPPPHRSRRRRDLKRALARVCDLLSSQEIVQNPNLIDHLTALERAPEIAALAHTPTAPDTLEAVRASAASAHIRRAFLEAPSTPQAEILSTEEPTVINDRGIVPASLPITIPEDAQPPTADSVHFTDLPSQDPGLAADTQSLVTDLFGPVQTESSASSWISLILSAIQTEVRNGLKDEARTSLLTKYETKNDLAALAPPKLNKELVAALPPSVVKRDEQQALAQSQVATCLNALGSGMSVLLQTNNLSNLCVDSRSALTTLADGIHLLADHHYRLSLARKAFTKLSLNLTGKKAADSSSIDEFLSRKILFKILQGNDVNCFIVFDSNCMQCCE